MRLLLLTSLVMIAFAANSVLNRAAVGPRLIGPVEFAVLRLLSGALILAGLVALRRASEGRAQSPAAGPRASGRLLGPVSLLVYLFGFSLAYDALDAGVGALILFGAVQITMFAGALASGEAVPRRRWLGAAVAFSGLVYLMAPGGGPGTSLPHAGIMLLAGIGWGVYSLAARGTEDPLGATARNFVLAAPVGALWLLWPGPAMTAQGMILAAVAGALTSGLGYALWYAILPGLGATRAAVAQLTVPVIAAAGGMALLGEALTLRFLLATLLVLGGVALALRAPRAQGPAPGRPGGGQVPDGG